MGSEKKLKNVAEEYFTLLKEADKAIINSDVYKRLLNQNTVIWEIEDKIRRKEQKLEFDREFIDLARSVYKENDYRAEIKSEINCLTRSIFKEEKEYVDYRN